MKKLMLSLPEELHTEFKVFSTRQGKPMNQLINELMDGAVKNNETKPKKEENKPLASENNESNFKLVDVSSIKSVRRATRKNTELVEQLKESILKIGLIKPILLRQTGINEFEALSSEAELQAAIIEAKKAKPIKCEMVNALIIPNDAIVEANNQVTILKKIL